MSIFPWKRKKEFFTAAEKESIIEAIRNAELKTSGEVRLFVESKCSYMDAIDRAAELFFSLKMTETADRNGVLVYVAMDDRQLAIVGDEGIHNKVGNEFWNHQLQKMINSFDKENYVEGIREIITKVGAALSEHFPYNQGTDKNELPDDIVFGK